MNFDIVVNALTIAGLIAMMLSMGFKVPPDEVTASIKQPRLIFMAVLANFVLVPLTTLGLLFLFRPDPLVSAGFIILAVCPAAPVAPPISAAAKGDVSYATGQMLILAGLSAILAPILLALIVPRLISGSQLHIDYLAIVRTLLISQILPLSVGLGVHRWAPRLTSRIDRPVAALANLLLVGVVALLLFREYESLATIRLRGWLGMLALSAASLVIGWLCGGPGTAKRKSLAITTAARNVAVALVIVSANFAQTPAVTAVVAYAFVSIFAALGSARLMAFLPEPTR